jgi:nicotinamidase-related amidase
MVQIEATPRPFPNDGLTRDGVAVMFIDMQRDFLEPGGYLEAMGYSLEGVRAAVEPARRLLDAARAAGLMVIHTRVGYRPDLGELSPHRRARVRNGDSIIGREGPLGRLLIRGEPGFQIIPELTPLPGEVIIDKSGTNAFWGTDLAPILAANQIRAILFAGATTDVCVHSTLREANDRGFECLLVRDACGSGDQYAHEAAIHMITVENGVFGVVADVAAVEAALARM